MMPECVTFETSDAMCNDNIAALSIRISRILFRKSRHKVFLHVINRVNVTNSRTRTHLVMLDGVSTKNARRTATVLENSALRAN